MTMWITERVPTDDVVAMLVPLLKEGTYNLHGLVAETDLTVEQVKRGLAKIRQQYAGANGLIYVYIPERDVYTFTDLDDEAINSTMNRLQDVSTRLLSLDAGKVQEMVARGYIKRRLGRYLIAAREEIKDFQEAL